MVLAALYANKIADTITTTIAATSTTSAAIDLGGASIAAIIFPAAFTGTTITFTVCDTASGTFVPLYDSSGSIVTVSVTVSAAVGFLITDFAAFRYVKIVSGSAEASERTLKIIPRVV